MADHALGQRVSGMRPRWLLAVLVAAGLTLTLTLGSSLAASSRKGRFKTYAVGGELGGIVEGPDGALWYPQSLTGLGRITAAGHHTGPYYDGPQSDQHDLSNEPEGITIGPDHGIWVAGMYDVYRYSTNGKFRAVSLGPNSEATAITAGPDGALWFTAASVDPNAPGASIDRMTTSGTITNNFPLANPKAQPEGIVSGPGGLWFTEYSGDAIGRITTSGQMKIFPLHTQSADPTSIVVGPDKNLWFTEARGKIGRITPSGKIKEFPLPISNSDPNGITSGPDHALWFTEGTTGQIGRITTAGKITEYSIPGVPGANESGSLAITAGPDHALWFTTGGLPKDVIGRYTPGG